MGYTTEFSGRFRTNEKMPSPLVREMLKFAEERHGGPSEVYEGYPGFWCQWVPSRDGEGVEWDGSEKFYYYEKWLKLIIERFIIPAGLKLNGTVAWFGEDPKDVGTIQVIDNLVIIHEGLVDKKQITI